MQTIEPLGREFAAYDVDRDAHPPKRKLLHTYSTAEEAARAHPEAQVKSVSTAQDHNNAMAAYHEAVKAKRHEIPKAGDEVEKSGSDTETRGAKPSK